MLAHKAVESRVLATYLLLRLEAAQRDGGVSFMRQNSSLSQRIHIANRDFAAWFGPHHESDIIEWVTKRLDIGQGAILNQRLIRNAWDVENALRLRLDQTPFADSLDRFLHYAIVARKIATDRSRWNGASADIAASLSLEAANILEHDFPGQDIPGFIAGAQNRLAQYALGSGDESVMSEIRSGLESWVASASPSELATPCV